jgi:hypothetical protein
MFYPKGSGEISRDIPRWVLLVVDSWMRRRATAPMYDTTKTKRGVVLLPSTYCAFLTRSLLCRDFAGISQVKVRYGAP